MENGNEGLGGAARPGRHATLSFFLFQPFLCYFNRFHDSPSFYMSCNFKSFSHIIPSY